MRRLPDRHAPKVVADEQPVLGGSRERAVGGHKRQMLERDSVVNSIALRPSRPVSARGSDGSKPRRGHPWIDGDRERSNGHSCSNRVRGRDRTPWVSVRPTATTASPVSAATNAQPLWSADAGATVRRHVEGRCCSHHRARRPIAARIMETALSGPLEGKSIRWASCPTVASTRGSLAIAMRTVTAPVGRSRRAEFTSATTFLTTWQESLPPTPGDRRWKTFCTSS